MTKFKEIVEEESIFYKQFVDCFLRGASLQDIYVDSNNGYATKNRAETTDQKIIEKRKESAKKEFIRIFDHQKNLITPIDNNFSFKEKKVLDFGCGTGALSIAMALRGAKVTGVDPTPVSLEACKYRAQYFGVDTLFTARLVPPSSAGIPFDDKSFDIVISNSVMEFIPMDRKEYIVKLLRLVKPSGLLIIATENGWFPFDYYTGQIFPRLRRKTMISKNLPYGLTYSEISSWIKSSGIKTKDLSKNNIFNSLDKLAERKMEKGSNGIALCVRCINAIFKRMCRLLSIPSDIFLPYTTFIYRVEE